MTRCAKRASCPTTAADAEARRRVRRMCEEGGDDAWSLSAQVTAVSKLLLEYM